MELLKLKANIRKATGNGPARRLRQEGKMPAVLYGNKTENILLSLNSKDIQTALKKSGGSQAFFNLILDEGSKKTVMLKELQRHPINSVYLHADLYEIDINRKIKTTIPVKIKGKSKGIEDGGILQVIRREIEIVCLLSEIPEAVEIDITELNIGDSIHIDEIDLGANVEIPFEQRFTILIISSPTTNKAIEEETEEEAEEEKEDENENEKKNRNFRL